MIITNDKTAIGKPGMTGVVIGENLVVLPFVNENVLIFEVRAIELEIFVQTNTGHNDDAGVYATERDLLYCLRFRIWQHQICKAHASLLFPVPYYNSSYRLSTCCDQKFVILRAEIGGDKLFGWVFGGAQDFTLLKRHIKYGLCPFFCAHF